MELCSQAHQLPSASVVYMSFWGYLMIFIMLASSWRHLDNVVIPLYKCSVFHLGIDPLDFQIQHQSTPFGAFIDSNKIQFTLYLLIPVLHLATTVSAADAVCSSGI